MDVARRVCAARRIGAAAFAGLALALACSAAPAGAQAEEAVWSPDLDCASCHPKEAASVEHSSAEAPAEGDAAGEAEPPASGEGAAESGGAAQASGQEPAASQGAAGEAGAEGETASAAVQEGAADAVGEAGGSETSGASGLESYAAMHAESLGVTCVTCHSDEAAMQKAHKNMGSGKEAKRLKRSRVGNEVCLSCHDQADLAERTAGSQALVDKQGTAVNPHDLPANENHEGVLCVSCHKAHDQETSVAENAQAACTSCHHAGVFECGTCH